MWLSEAFGRFGFRVSRFGTREVDAGTCFGSMRFLPLRPYLAVSRMFGRRAADGLVWPFVHTLLNAELDRSLARAAIASGVTEGSPSPATAFEAALRPLLVPRERADDLDAWAQSNFCRAWVRKGWLGRPPTSEASKRGRG